MMLYFVLSQPSQLGQKERDLAWLMIILIVFQISMSHKFFLVNTYVRQNYITFLTVENIF